MEKQIDLTRLQDFFASGDIEWKPITVSKKTNKGLAAAYVTNRAIMDRLDEVCGPENWKNEFRPGPGGGIVCGLSIRVGDGWVTKWDGAENTDIEPVKGGLSSAMRRAAVHWGIGRYLYRLPMQWVPVDERGRFVKPPTIPAEYRPASPGDGSVHPEPAPAVTPHRRSANGAPRSGAAEGSGGQGAAQNVPPQRARSKRRRASDEEYFMPGDLPF